MTEAAIDTGLFRDLYVSMGEPIPGSQSAWAVRVYFKPFVDWIWAGCLMMALGGVLAISDRRYRLHQKTEDRSPRKGDAGGYPAASLPPLRRQKTEPILRPAQDSGQAASTYSGHIS